LLLVAPPGAGKGTQARLLASHFGIAHLASGDLLRQEVAAGTEIGRAAAAFLARGDLVPDSLVIEMLRQPIIEAAARGGYVLDGFPRSIGQAEQAYQVALEVSGIELQAVVHLLVDPDELRRRLLARAENEGRVDDNEATIAHRLDVYDTETAPILAFYANRGLVVDVDGNQPVEAVFSDIVKTVEAVRAGLR
jgi:adenylate kinase